MARIHELLTQLRAISPALAADIGREVDALSDRRSFGLNFERHAPEAVELPGRKIRTGDKVRTQPLRGEKPTATGRVLYRVVSIERHDGRRVASIAPLGAEPEGAATGGATELVDADDLVFVAEFRDPIHPGLVSTGKVERGSGRLGDPGDKPYHAVINAENFHALQTLLFTHRGKVDAIYIDPPYNTGARDWKYNNDYVESDDLYRHSKWLAFMERRLLLAKELLNPDDSVLIVTIDEKEYLRLGLLLEQTFPEARIQKVSTVISQKGSARTGEFSRCDEFVFFVMLGTAAPESLGEDMLHEQLAGRDDVVEVEWGRLGRNGANGLRTARPNLFYPIFLNSDGSFHSTGESLPPDVDRDSVVAPQGTVAVFPLLSNGQEMSWSLSRDKLDAYAPLGYLKFGSVQPHKHQKAMVYYLTSGYVAEAQAGTIVQTGTTRSPRWVHTSAKGMKPMTVWNKVSHDAGWHGSRLLSKFLGDRKFPFPKSLFAVEDALRFFVASKPRAVIIDFFSGSGTTAHAVMRLNHQDSGGRQAILITNNEVGAEEQKTLRKQGLRPGDADWEKRGICDYITKPRIRAAITGTTPDGQSIQGDYKFSDVFPLADGFDENVEFFNLTYEAPMRVQSNRVFARIAPFLWLRAGSRGRRVDSLETGWDVADAYGVISDLDQTEAFIAALAAKPGAEVAFIVTDEDRLFEAVVRDLPEGVEPVRMYEAYLRNFEIDAMRSVR